MPQGGAEAAVLLLPLNQHESELGCGLKLAIAATTPGIVVVS